MPVAEKGDLENSRPERPPPPAPKEGVPERRYMEAFGWRFEEKPNQIVQREEGFSALPYRRVRSSVA